MLVLIFSFSEQNGEESGELSYRVGVEVFTVTNYVFDKGWTKQHISNLSRSYQFIIRKIAHFSEFFLLGLSLLLPLYVFGLRDHALSLTCVFLCITVAGLDEYHQSFIADRGPSVKDVIIDSCGSATAVLIYHITCLMKKKKEVIKKL